VAPEPKKRRRRNRRQLRKPLEAKRPPGRPPFVPTDEQRRRVEALVACDFSNQEIAIALGIAISTMEVHFREELNSGRTKVFTDIAGSMVQQAREGDKTMQIYLSKARMGWRERTVGVGVESRANSEEPRNVFTISITG
jgi:hypothetical protein